MVSLGRFDHNAAARCPRPGRADHRRRDNHGAHAGDRRIAGNHSALGTIQPWEGATDLFIHSSFDVQAIDGLITNFHLPRSTLLVLVRAFGGDELMTRAYEEAIQEEYRFFSYGDAMLIV